MNVESILTAVWGALNSPVGIAAVAGVILWILNRVYAKKPAWQAFEGTIIAAVKWAEKAIPDDTENTAAKRFDEALRYVLKVYESAQKRRANSKEIVELGEGIKIVHAELETHGNL